MNSTYPAELVFDNPDLRAMILKQKTIMEVERIQQHLLDRRVKYALQEKKKAESRSWNRKKKNTKNKDTMASAYHKTHAFRNRPMRIDIPFKVDNLKQDGPCYEYDVHFKTSLYYYIEKWESAPMDVNLYYFENGKISSVYEEYMISRTYIDGRKRIFWLN